MEEAGNTGGHPARPCAVEVDVTTSSLTPAATRTRVDRWWLAAIGSVLVAVLLASIYSPDLVTGTQQEHLALPAVIDWMWAGVAIGYLASVGPARADATLAVATALLWFSVAAASIFAPEFVTGTDPTRIPIVALIAPVIGTVMTGFLCLHAVQATRG